MFIKSAGKLTCRKTFQFLASRNCSSHQAAINLQSYDQFQVDLLKEQCITVNKKDEMIGSASKMDCHLKSLGPPLHRAFSVFLFNQNNELLLQKRADSKILFPGHYTNTCCSHPLNTSNEKTAEDALGVKVAAQRRCWQELGISADQLPIDNFHFLTRIHYQADSCKKWAENEIDYILFIKAQTQVELTPCENEVSEITWVSQHQMEDFIERCRREDVPLTPWFRLILSNGLMKWWDHVDDVNPVQDHDTIHRL